MKQRTNNGYQWPTKASFNLKRFNGVNNIHLVRRSIVELLMRTNNSSDQERAFAHMASRDQETKYLKNTFAAVVIKMVKKNIELFDESTKRQLNGIFKIQEETAERYIFVICNQFINLYYSVLDDSIVDLNYSTDSLLSELVPYDEKDDSELIIGELIIDEQTAPTAVPCEACHL